MQTQIPPPTPLFSPIAIEAIAAVAPEFENLADIFATWRDGRKHKPRGDSGEGGHEQAGFRELCGRILAEIRPGSGGDLGRNLLLATTKGDIAAQVEWMRQLDAAAPVTAPPATLSTALQSITVPDKFQTNSYVISTACTSGLTALIDAAICADNHLTVVAADVAMDFIHDGFTALRALSSTACRPFDRHRDGLSLGTAAAACTLSRSPQVLPLAWITGFSVTNDATHMTAPDREGKGLITAIRQALQMAQLQPSQIDAVLAHGTATRYNDAMEALAIRTIFHENGAMPAITAVKGLLGHTLGASGLIETALTIEMLRHQVIPPVTGLQTPENSELNLVQTARPERLRHILKIASGFGGMNAAVILSHPDAHPTSTLSAEIHIPVSTHILAAATESSTTESLSTLATKAITPLLQLIPEKDLASTGLILGTALGCLETDREFDRSRREANGRYASPATFSRTLPSTLPAEIAIHARLRGPSLLLSAGNASTATALRRALAWMHAFNLPFCIAGGFDETGPGLGLPTGQHIALVLLSRSSTNSTALMSFDPNKRFSPNLSSLRDDSLHVLSDWIKNPQKTTLTPGLHLSPIGDQ